jgi:uncharacterized protein
MPLVLFAPGAGAPSTSDWMKAWRRRLSKVGKVVAFDYRYMKEGRRSPDRLPQLIEAHRAALARARKRHPGPVVLAGKSMGSRMGCHVALEEPVDALVCFGYPLKGLSGAVRDEVLLKLRTPILFIQGTRDPLCPLDLLERVRRRMKAPSTLHVVDSGDHSLQVLKRSAQPQAEVDRGILEVVRAFLADNLRGSTPP